MINKRFRRPFYLIIAFAILSVHLACTSSLPPVNADSKGIAIKGYDAVAYHSMDKPLIGRNAFAFEWNGAKWLFANEEHMRLFMDFPDRYAPKYGGYCAYAVSQGSTADIDPEAWTIVKQSLYLNLNKETKTLWKKDMIANINKADSNWPGVLKQK